MGMEYVLRTIKLRVVLKRREDNRVGIHKYWFSKSNNMSMFNQMKRTKEFLFSGDLNR